MLRLGKSNGHLSAVVLDSFLFGCFGANGLFEWLLDSFWIGRNQGSHHMAHAKRMDPYVVKFRSSRTPFSILDFSILENWDDDLNLMLHPVLFFLLWQNKVTNGETHRSEPSAGLCRWAPEGVGGDDRSRSVPLVEQTDPIKWSFNDGFFLEEKRYVFWKWWIKLTYDRHVIFDEFLWFASSVMFRFVPGMVPQGCEPAPGDSRADESRWGALWVFPECVARVPVSLGGLGVRLCSPKVAFATATVGNRSQPSAVTP